MMLVTKYQVTEKNATKNILDGRKDGRTDGGKTVYPPSPSGSGGIIILYFVIFLLYNLYIKNTEAEDTKSDKKNHRSI
jgi:hypothetical protein